MFFHNRDRYSRHALYDNMMRNNQEESQNKLKSCISSNIVINLVGAGIGEFTVVAAKMLVYTDFVILSADSL